MLALAFAEKYTSDTDSDNIQIVATDLADGMLEQLENKLVNKKRYQQFRANIKTIQMDGQILDKLESESIDIVGSNFGLSIFPDRIKAWGSSYRVLKEGGLLVATAWDAQSPNLGWADAWASLIHEVYCAKSRSDPTVKKPDLTLPSSKVGSSGDQIANELRAAGFRHIDLYCTKHSVVFQNPQILVNTMLNNPGAAGFIEVLGRERVENVLYDSILQDGFTNIIVSEEGKNSDSFDVKTSALPFTLEFVGHIVSASK